MNFYPLARGLAGLLLTVFYRRIDVAGLEHVPTGPLLVVANHHNALVDPLLIPASIPRQIVPIAKAPLFDQPVMGLLLHLVGAIPVARREDADPSIMAERNAAMFARTTETLVAGGAILIFPEGVSQPEPILMPLRTGAARILLNSAHASRSASGVPALVPFGLVYDAPATFRGGQASVLIGAPIESADILDQAMTSHKARFAR